MHRALPLALIALAASPALAADGGVSAGLSGGVFLSDPLEVLGDTLVIAPRVGYWINPTLGFELDLQLMPVGRTQVGDPDPYPYLGVLPMVNMVGRVFEDEPVNLLLNVGVGGFLKKVNDDGNLELPTEDRLDLDLAASAGPGFFVPFGKGSPLGVRTEYRWILNLGTENWENHGDQFINGEWTLGVMYLKSGPKDTDKDGIVDEDDSCDAEAEDVDGFEDTDGCPDADNDKDGVADANDKAADGTSCADAAEDLDEFEDADGCPDPDNDQDGVADADDQCRFEKGTAATGGCPDQDGDSLVDADDECPAEAGPTAAGGCPDRDGDLVPDLRDKCPDEKHNEGANPAASDGCPAKMFVGDGKIVITEKVQFDTGKAVIKPVSFELLDGVAKLLADNRGIKRLQVEGHTDDQGDDAKNLKLSQDRADSVKAYLVGKGIDAERLVAIGYGETKPMGDNKTADGREQNRRVEFNILESDLGKRMKKELREERKEGEMSVPPAPAAPAPAPAAPAPAPAAPAAAPAPAAPAAAPAPAAPAPAPAAPAPAPAAPAPAPAAPAPAPAAPAPAPAAPAPAPAAPAPAPAAPEAPAPK